MTVVCWVFWRSGVCGFAVMNWKGCHSNSRHGNTHLVTNFCCFKSFGPAGGSMPLLRIWVTNCWWPFSVYFPATGLLPKLRAIRSQLPLWLLFLSAAMLLCHAIEGLYSLCISKSQRNTYFSKFLRSCCFIFIVLYLFISISYIIPFPIFPATNLVSPPPASMTVLPHSPTHSCLDTQAFLDSGSSRLHRTKGLRSQWCPIRQSSTTYPAGAMCATKCTLCLV